MRSVRTSFCLRASFRERLEEEAEEEEIFNEQIEGTQSDPDTQTENHAES